MATGHDIIGYDVIDTLGYGAHSTIFAVRDPKDNQMYALKRIVKSSPKDQRFVDQAVLEHEVANKVDHPALRKSLKLVKQRNTLLRTTEVLVLMELVEGQTLEQGKPNDVAELCKLGKQLADGLASMHSHGYAHGDIKPNNILINNRQHVKIIDFGQSCTIGTIKLRIQGTPDYIAPEQVLRRAITPMTDVFNLGATMYWLLTNSHVPTLIPRGRGSASIRSKKRKVKEPRDINPRVPLALSRLVMSCVRTDPAKRPDTMIQVRDRLELALLQLSRDGGLDPKETDDENGSSEEAER